MRGLAPARVRQARGGGDAHWLVSPVPAPGTDSTPSRRAGRRRAVPVADDGPRQFAHRGRGRGSSAAGAAAAVPPKSASRRAFRQLSFRETVGGRSEIGQTMTSLIPSHVCAHGRCPASAGESRRDGGAPEGAVSRSAARSSGSRSATPPVPGRSSRAFALTRRARLPSRDSRRADPRLSSPRRRSARRRWSRCARWASASSKRFVKRAPRLSPVEAGTAAFSPRTRKRGDGHPSPSSRSGVLGNAVSRLTSSLKSRDAPPRRAP